MALKYIIIFLVFLFFLISITILLNPTLCFEYQDYARDLLIHFVETTKLLYGPYYITHNFHALTHIADDVTTFGSLDNCSAFQYENFLQFFKRQIRKGDRPLQQMVKRLGEMADSDFWFNKKSEYSTEPSVSGLHENGPVIEGCDASRQFKSIKFSSFKITMFQPNSIL